MTNKPMESSKTFFNVKLRKIRLMNDLTLKEVSEQLFKDYGEKLSTPYISEIESGKTCPSLKSLAKLCKFYSVPMSELFEDIDEDLIISLNAKERRKEYVKQKDLKELERLKSKYE